MTAPYATSPARPAATASHSLGVPAPLASFESLVDELRVLIVKVANLPDVQPMSIDPNEPLYRDGLGLDSIDVLELVVNVERTYGLKIRNDEPGRMALRNVSSLASALHGHLAASAVGDTPGVGSPQEG